jgi:CII-binding regulator of phage lambda lysogenization HflD
VVVEAETKRLESTIEVMHGDMARLNEIIGKNVQLQSELQHTTSVMEMEFVHELKELELESVAMERRLQEAKQQKASLLDEIVEAERQLLMWEKKIQLEKETQAALDPNVGTSEIHAMEKVEFAGRGWAGIP